jgi:hypothetical protein
VNPPNTTAPGVGLVLVGIGNLIYALIYGIWTTLGLMGGGFIALSQVLAATGVTQAETNAGTILLGVLAAVAPFIQLVAYVIVAGFAAVTLFGGVRLLLGRSPGVVKVGALLGVLGPVLGLLANAMSLLNIGTLGLCFFGFFGGSLGSLVPLAFALPFSIWGYVAASAEGYGE